MDANSLIECPFCGSHSAHVIEIDASGWAVICGTCGVLGPSRSSPAEAAEHWNTRLPPVADTRHPAASEQ